MCEAEKLLKLCSGIMNLDRFLSRSFFGYNSTISIEVYESFENIKQGVNVILYVYLYLYNIYINGIHIPFSEYCHRANVGIGENHIVGT